MTHGSAERARKVGFISPPRWFDPAPAEFPTVCRAPVLTQQMPLPPPDFDYRLESIAGVESELTLATRTLAAGGCELVVQVGTPFAWAGTVSEADARMRCARIAATAGVPIIMTGLAIVDALRAIGAERPALACTYYDDDWRDAWASFVRTCGFEPVRAATMADQKLVDRRDTLESYGFDMPEELARRSILRVAADAPEADVLVVTGAGVRTLTLIEPVEAESGRPLVAADTAAYWAAAQALGVELTCCMGRLGLTSAL